MIIETVRTLYAYNTWANAQILEASARLAPARLVEARGASFDSIHDTLVHTMAAQWLWLERWQGRSPSAMPGPSDFADLSSIRARWDEIERATRAFVGGLHDGDLGRVIEYTNFQGERWAYPLWQQLVHQVNHATQHRSEAAMILTQLGCSPGWLDFLYFVDIANQPGRAR